MNRQTNKGEGKAFLYGRMAANKQRRNNRVRKASVSTKTSD